MTTKKQTFFGDKEKQRLSKVLAAAGVASRRAAEELIFAGRVKVNGEAVFVPQTLVSSEDNLVVDNKLVDGLQKKVYYILNKPSGCICSNTRIGSKRLVLDLFTHLNTRLFTVGRLDRDTTGLIIVTNDGHFAQKVIHPSSGIAKEYLIKTEEEVSAEHLAAISAGMWLEDRWIKPRQVTKVRGGTLKIVVMEGKKREVRLLVGKAGLTLVELKRIRIGGLTLGNLEMGQFREMSEGEKKAIFG